MIAIDLSGTNGPSQRFLSGIARRSNDAAAAASYAKQNYDPGFNASTRADAVSFGNDAAAAKAAQGAVYGSIAQRDDPNRYGSVASRQFGSVFGPDGAANPDAPQNQQQGIQRRAAPAAASQSSGSVPQGGISPAFLSQLFSGFQQRRPSAASADPTTAFENDNERDDDHG